MYSGMLVIIQVCSSVSGTWLMCVHLKKIKILALMDVVTFVVNQLEITFCIEISKNT